MEAVKQPIKMLRVNPELCSGCERCMIVCSLFHDGVCNPALSRIRIVKNSPLDYTPQVCRQCIAPACMAVCTVEAIHLDEETSARVVDEEECTGCDLCVEACLFGMMRFNEEKQVAFSCDLCGGDPKCVEFCPMKAIEFA